MRALSTFISLGATAGLLCLGFVALAQNAPPGQGEPAAPPAAAPVAPTTPAPGTPPTGVPAPAAPAAPDANPGFRPGFIDAFGRWLQEGRETFDRQMKGAREAFDNLHNKARDNAKEAAGALSPSRVVNGHARCEVAQNGAPDCAMAANAVCIGKGYKSGKSVATQTEEKCPARVWLSGRSPSAGECKAETYVTRAVCQ